MLSLCPKDEKASMTMAMKTKNIIPSRRKRRRLVETSRIMGLKFCEMRAKETELAKN